MMQLNTIHNTGCPAGLKILPGNSVDCCVTSPPYYALRDYGCEGQIGLEDTPEAYIARLLEVFSEVYRVLKPAGTLWLNIGDSYNGSSNGRTTNLDAEWRKKSINKNALKGGCSRTIKCDNMKNKDLIGIPWMLAFALRKAGWYLRQDIIWHKPNAMPETVKDRCTSSHEYIFLLAKSATYHFDHEAITELASTGQYRHKRDVWPVCTKPEKESHFAVFPEALIADCIKAGCPEGGVVLDPFMGSGTTAVVARKLNRNYIGFELNPEYIKISNRKLNRELGIFK
ncbi:MAG: site-specific DNA-methyltransferase [Prevotella sp.]|jgi:DNA modification methylase|nr:site-specific DNA-methyltransferase [Prevotella sp.]